MCSTLNYSLKKKDDRAFENPFMEKTRNGKLVESEIFVDIERMQVAAGIHESINECAQHLLAEWHNQILSEESSDFSVYTGISGYALLYLNLSKLCRNETYFKEGCRLAKKCVTGLKGRRFAFLSGDGGVLAVAAVFAHKANEFKERDLYIARLHKIYSSRDVLEQESNELLYGKAGCLYSLLFVRKHIGNDAVDSGLIDTLVKSILHSGKQFSTKQKRKGLDTPPLLYEWHEKVYFAAAHGMAGIFFVLFQAIEFLDHHTLIEVIKPSLDYLLAFRFPSGNFPSSLTNTNDRLVQWCHGAPGFVHCLTAAAQVYKDDVYLKAAEKCADVIWERGLLQKGYGLCHGAAGNGYAFLNLFQVTRNPLYLQRALKFAQFCCDYGKHGCRIPDRPLSLFEGMAGTINFLFDVTNPLEAKFPAYEI